jgi:hypothetical protein
MLDVLDWMVLDVLGSGTGGETGIRTLDTVSRIHAFQACAFSHSAISPRRQAQGPHAGFAGAKLSRELVYCIVSTLMNRESGPGRACRPPAFAFAGGIQYRARNRGGAALSAPGLPLPRWLLLRVPRRRVAQPPRRRSWSSFPAGGDACNRAPVPAGR